MNISSPVARRITGAIAAVGVFLVAVEMRGGVNTADSGQFSSQVTAVSSGHLSQAFPVPAGSATPPGFAILAGVLLHVGVGAAAVGVACALFLAGAAAALARSVDPCHRTSRATLAFAGALALPAVWGSLQDLFHPQDLLGMALVCLALRAALANRWMAAGIWLGAAFVTKQWAVLAAVPVIALAPSWPARCRATAGCFSTAGLLLAPFFAADPAGTVRVLRAATVTRSEISLIAHAPVPAHVVDLAARLGPIVVTAVLVGARMVIRQVKGFPDRSIGGNQLVALTLACLATRLVFDPALYLYYLVPSSILLLVLEVPKRRFPVVTAAWCLLTLDLLAVPGHSAGAATVDAALLFGLALTASAVGFAHAIGSGGSRRTPSNAFANTAPQPPLARVDSHSPEYLVTQG